MPGGVNAASAIQPNTTLDCLECVKDKGHIVSFSGDTVEPVRDITIDQISHDIDISAELIKLYQKHRPGMHVEK